MSNSPVNLNNIREIAAGNSELEKALFNEFINSAEECLAILEDQNDANKWREAAHALKGSSINLGAENLFGLCKKAQDEYASSIDFRKSLTEAIKEEYHKVKAFLTSLHPL